MNFKPVSQFDTKQIVSQNKKYGDKNSSQSEPYLFAKSGMVYALGEHFVISASIVHVHVLLL